jgi:hypothetical protein
MAGNMWLIFCRQKYCRSEFAGGVRGGGGGLININGSKSFTNSFLAFSHPPVQFSCLIWDL